VLIRNVSKHLIGAKDMKRSNTNKANIISRRQFCRSAIATAAIPLVQLLASSPPPKPKVKFYKNLSPGHIGLRANQQQSLEYAAKYGFDSIAPNSNEFKEASNSQISDWLSQMKQKGIRYGTAGLPVDFRKDEQRFKQGLIQLPRQATILNRLGVTRMATWIMPGDEKLTYLQNFNQHKTRLRKVAEILNDYNIRLGLEFVGPRTSRARFRFPFASTQYEMLELTQAIGTNNTGLLLDSWHWYTSHGTTEELIQLTNKHIVHVHVNDAPKGIDIDNQQDNKRRLPATTGVIDLKGFVNALVKIGYDGPIECEPFDSKLRAMPDPEKLKLTIDSLNRLWALIGESKQ
jgi:sugar phosphate isomerase/epimerase